MRCLCLGALADAVAVRVTQGSESPLITLGFNTCEVLKDMDSKAYSQPHLPPFFQGMKVFFMVVAAVYILYLLFLVVRACSELRHMPYVGERHSGKHGAPGATPPKPLSLENP